MSEGKTLDFAEAAAHTCPLQAGVTEGNVVITLHVGVKVRKMTHGKSAPLVCHQLHKGQGFGGRGANVVHPTLLETAKGCTLVGVHEPFVASASDGMTEIITSVSALGEFVHIFQINLTKRLYLKNASCKATCMSASGLIFCFLMNSFP